MYRCHHWLEGEHEEIWRQTAFILQLDVAIPVDIACSTVLQESLEQNSLNLVCKNLSKVWVLEVVKLPVIQCMQSNLILFYYNLFWIVHEHLFLQL